MASTGRRPKPVEQHIADGTFRPDRHTAPDFGSPVVSLPVPKTARSPEAVQAWHDLTAPLFARRVVHLADAASLEIAAGALARWRKAASQVAEDGELIPGRFGQMVAHPCIAIAEKAANEFARWCVRFGITPSDRAAFGLSVLPSPAGSGWGDLDDD